MNFLIMCRNFPIFDDPNFFSEVLTTFNHTNTTQLIKMIKLSIKCKTVPLCLIHVPLLYNM